MTVGLIVLWGGVVVIWCCMYMMVRNNKIHEYRIRLLGEIHEKGVAEINEGKMVKDIEWRLQEFDKVTYDEMFWKFWRKVDSFYEGNACLNDRKPPELSDTTVEDIL